MSKRHVWVRVRQIFEEEIPILLHEDEPADEAVKRVKSRNPEDRIKASARIRWEYELIG